MNHNVERRLVIVFAGDKVHIEISLLISENNESISREINFGVSVLCRINERIHRFLHTAWNI